MARTLIDWTEERVEILKRMWGEGCTGQQIADRLGVSRSGVLGKVHHLGLDRPQEMNRRNCSKGGKTTGAIRSKAVKMQFGKGKPSRSPKPITPAAPRPPKPPIPTAHLSTITGAFITGPKPVPPRPLADPAEASGEFIDIMAITSRNCCWPELRDPTDDEWRFCGQIRDDKSGNGDRGYCTKHRRIAIGRAA